MKSFFKKKKNIFVSSRGKTVISHSFDQNIVIVAKLIFDNFYVGESAKLLFIPILIAILVNWEYFQNVKFKYEIRRVGYERTN